MRNHLKRSLAVAGGLLGLIPALAVAQQGTTVTGLVTNEASSPLQGASVSIPALSIGAYTNAAGQYTFTVPANRTGTVTLTARRLGYEPQSVSITLNGATVTQNFRLIATPTQLTGVVVTALSQEKEKSQLGTAQQQLTSSEITQTKGASVLNSLQGKVSGVTITGSGQPGGSTQIILRGANSITGDNTPLFIVDGIPISKNDRGADANSGWDFGSAINDLNPDDIETMSILKGPNAAALYGSRAANGVIVITTKRGRNTNGRIRTELNTFYTFENPSILPDYQNSYGQGAGGAFRFADGAGGGVNDGADQSWGPRLAGQPIDQFTGKAQPWVAHPNNVSSFFQTGHTASATLAVSGGTDKANARLSVGTDNNESYVPNTYITKTNALLNGDLKINEKWSADATVQYIRDVGRNRPGVGYANSIMEQFIWFGRQVDMSALKQNWQKSGALNGGPAGREFNWNYNYHNNPFFLQYGNPEEDGRDRIIGSGTVNYSPTDWLRATLLSGSDIYRYNIDQRWSPADITGAPVDQSYAGAFQLTNDYNNENNTQLLLTADKQLLSSIHANATFGGNVRKETYSSDFTRVTGMSVPGIFNVSNAAVSPSLSQYNRQRQVNSVLGSASFTYNNWWTVEGTARNDWSSTLPKGQNSYFYPSVNTSLVLSDAFPSLRNRVLSYLKLRGSLAQVGNDAPPFSLRTTYAGFSTKFAGQPQFTLSDVIANPNLKPEITNSGEVGVELSLLDNRVSLDASYYNKATRNQIFNVAVSPASGFGFQSINAGKITNKGTEALLTVIPVQMSNGFTWTSSFNFSQNRSRVAQLYVTPVGDSVKTIVLGGTWYVNVEARLGQPYGALYGYAFARDSAGNLLVKNGLTQVGGRKVLGNIQPNWTGGWSNTLTYKNLTLSALLDIKSGGDIYSVSNYFGEYSGVFKSTMKGRELDWNNPGIVVKGIDVKTGKPNTVRVTAEQYFQNIFPVNEPYIYKDSYVKLRELRLGFDLPQRWAGRFFNAEGMSIALSGRNLFTWTKVPNIDPEFSYQTGNVQGIEYAVLPNARTFGISLRVTP